MADLSTGAVNYVGGDAPKSADILGRSKAQNVSCAPVTGLMKWLTVYELRFDKI